MRTLSRRIVKKPPDVVIKKKSSKGDLGSLIKRKAESLLPPLLDLKKPTESLQIINERPRYLTRGHFKEEKRLSSPSLTKSTEGPPLTKKFKTFRERRRRIRDSSNESANKGESALPSLCMDLSKDSFSIITPPVIAEKVRTVRRKVHKHASLKRSTIAPPLALTSKSQKFREALLTKIYFPNPKYPPPAFLTTQTKTRRRVRNLTPLKHENVWNQAQKLYRGRDGHWLGKLAGISRRQRSSLKHKEYVQEIVRAFEILTSASFRSTRRGRSRLLDLSINDILSSKPSSVLGSLKRLKRDKSLKASTVSSAKLNEPSVDDGCVVYT